MDGHVTSSTTRPIKMKNAEYKKVDVLNALKHFGYFEVSGALVSRIKKLSKEIEGDFKKFVKLSDEEKLKYVVEDESLYMGYQSLSDLSKKYKSRFESLIFSRQALSVSEPFYPKNPKIKEIPGLSEKCEKLVDLIDKLNVRVFADLAKELELNKDYFNSKLEYGERRLRLLAYKKDSDKSQIGIHRHIDHTFFTLNIDPKHGLYITHKGKSSEYKGKSDSVLYMPGSIMGHISGQKIPATLHKVRLQPKKERISIVCLINFRPLAHIEVVGEKSHGLTSVELLESELYKEGFYSKSKYGRIQAQLRTIKKKYSDKKMLNKIRKTK